MISESVQLLMDAGSGGTLLLSNRPPTMLILPNLTNNLPIQVYPGEGEHWLESNTLAKFRE